MSRNFKLALTILVTSTALTACMGPKKDDTSFQPPPELGPKWGFIDHSGKFIIKPQFRRALTFSEGLAAADLSARWGFIDNTGKWVIERQFEDVGGFHKGFAGVKPFSAKWQLINKDGAACSPATFEAIGDCGQASKPLEPTTIIYCPYKDGQKWGYISSTGEIKIQPAYENADPFSEGMAAVSKAGKWTYIDNTGKQICDFKFDKAEPFHDRVGEAYFGSDFVMIDDNGTMSMSDPLNSTTFFRDGLGLKLKKGKYGFINKTGKTVIKARFTYAEDFSEALAVVGVVNARRGYIDPKGHFVIPPVFDEAFSFSDKLAAVKIDPRFVGDDGTISASEVESALKNDPHAAMPVATDAAPEAATDTGTATNTSTSTSTSTATSTSTSTSTGTATGTATSTSTSDSKDAAKDTKAPAKDAAAKAPGKDVPVKTPVKDAPVKDTKDAASKDAPAKDASVKDSKAGSKDAPKSTAKP